MQLLQYGNFLDKYTVDLCNFKEKLPNNLNVRLEPILLQVSKITNSVSVVEMKIILEFQE